MWNKSLKIKTVDLSWPTIREVFINKISDSVTGRAKMLKDIIGVATHQDCTWEAIKERYGKRIVDMCLNDEDSLFILTPVEYRDRFEEHLRSMLKNHTGFQRIMSLLAVSILNSTKDAFVPGFSRVRVAINEETENSYSYKDRELRIKPSALVEVRSSTFHESTHPYNAMIGMFRHNDSFVSTYSILNSKDADFLGLFFPMLKKENMDKVVEEIAKRIDMDKFSRIKNDSWLGRRGRQFIIKNMFKTIVDKGFASLVFLTANGSFGLKDILTPKMLAKATYIFCSAMGFTDDGAESIWSNGDEMITMTGLLPILDDNNTNIIEDRQNEEVYKIRQLEEKLPNVGIDDYKKQFTVHAADFVTSKDISHKIAEYLNMYNYGPPLSEENEQYVFPEMEIDVKPKHFRFGYGDTTAAQK
ncbi:hypothetical protein FACS189449_06420 [Alphaproteobacteria bacterium]|nr:hypothetical protein FACS189449_06420 [Alphaproteobacteria bacterium]